MVCELEQSYLERLFKPKSIAVIGASEKHGTVGRAIMENLLGKFRGEIYPVNVKYETVFSLKCYKGVNELPKSPDLAVVAIPAASTPKAIEELCKLGVRVSIVVSAGFKEVGEEGARLEVELVRKARTCGMRVLGPNCLGVYDAWTGVDTIFNPSDRQSKPSPGSVAFLSQSGALGAALLDWLAEAGIGMSKFVSYGNAADIKEWELIEYLARDETTRIISLYVEGVEDGREFLNSLRKAVMAGKPVVVLKGGRTPTGVKAAVSHTGALSSSAEVFLQAVKQAGAIAVDSISDMVGVLKLLEWFEPPKGRSIAIVTNGGGAGVLAVDAVEAEGLKMAVLSKETIESLRRALPSAASTLNPIDILGDAPPERYRVAIDLVVNDINVDSVLIITLMQSPAFDPHKFVELLLDIRNKTTKPMVLVAPGGEYTEKHARIVEKKLRVPYFKSPEEAVKALKLCAEWFEKKMKGTRYS
ncbi:MAG: CoA-binding protein [Sulfolobales archaeon]